MKHYHILYELPGKPVKLYYGMDGYLTTEHDKAKTFVNLKAEKLGLKIFIPSLSIIDIANTNAPKSETSTCIPLLFSSKNLLTISPL